MKRREKPRVAGGVSRRGRRFGDELAEAARAIVADTRRAVADCALSDPQKVHEVRKALKRWRALMRLLAEPLGDSADRMRAEAAELMRSLAQARDAQGALDALTDLRKVKLPISATSIEAMRRRLAAMRGAAEAANFTPEMRARLKRFLGDATLAIEGWPLGTIDFKTVARGLTETYRRTRRRVPKAWKKTTPEQLHDLRRRVVEHRHQMDMIEHVWPRLTKAWVEETQRLRNQLGACQDLAVLNRFSGPDQPLAQWRPQLKPAIAARHAARIKSAARLAGRLFAEKPKAFANRIEALWSVRPKKKPRA